MGFIKEIEGSLYVTGSVGNISTVTLTQPVSQIWTDIFVNKPAQYLIIPNATNYIVKLPKIGDNSNEAPNGRVFTLKNLSSVQITIQDFDGSLVTTLDPNKIINLTSDEISVSWEFMGVMNATSSSSTLQDSYNVSTNPMIKLDTGKNGLKIVDDDSNNLSELFFIAENDGAGSPTANKYIE